MCIGPRPSSNISFPMKTFRFLQVGIHLSVLLFSVPLSWNHSLGFVLEFLYYWALLPSLWGRQGPRLMYVWSQVLAGCVACGKIGKGCWTGVRKRLLFLPFKNSFFLCSQPPSPNIQCDDPKPAASVLVMSCKIGHPVFKRSSVSLFWLAGSSHDAQLVSSPSRSPWNLSVAVSMFPFTVQLVDP